jgi:hypothetical protein
MTCMLNLFLRSLSNRLSHISIICSNRVEHNGTHTQLMTPQLFAWWVRDLRVLCHCQESARSMESSSVYWDTRQMNEAAAGYKIDVCSICGTRSGESRSNPHRHAVLTSISWQWNQIFTMAFLFAFRASESSFKLATFCFRHSLKCHAISYWIVKFCGTRYFYFVCLIKTCRRRVHAQQDAAMRHMLTLQKPSKNVFRSIIFSTRTTIVQTVAFMA